MLQYEIPRFADEDIRKSGNIILRNLVPDEYVQTTNAFLRSLKTSTNIEEEDLGVTSPERDELFRRIIEQQIGDM